jgi:hypothetical protein
MRPTPQIRGMLLRVFLGALLVLPAVPVRAQTPGAIVPRPAVADAAPDFELDTADGVPFRLFEAAAGRPVVLQFAAPT